MQSKIRNKKQLQKLIAYTNVRRVETPFLGTSKIQHAISRVKNRELRKLRTMCLLPKYTLQAKNRHMGSLHVFQKALSLN